MYNPYQEAPDVAFWSRAVARRWDPSSLLDGEIVRSGDRIMSAGSCFASNMVPFLEQAGYSYTRTEPRSALFGVPPEKFGYDDFSASYGNIYTARQMLQTLQRALGSFVPVEKVWQDGQKFLDPYRPGLLYAARSLREFEILTRQHLAAVVRAIEQSDVFIFTLGLTEAWVSRRDGAVFPACPGTVSGKFDPKLHEFINFSVGDVRADLISMVALARSINPTLRFVLTVSPVPLVATFSGRHVVQATIYSKSVLRVAADEAAAALPNVSYFPAYEIVTGPQAPDDYFEADRRRVSRRAIETVMATFLGSEVAVPPVAEVMETASEVPSFADAECEEAMADAVGRQSVFARAKKIWRKR